MPEPAVALYLRLFPRTGWVVGQGLSIQALPQDEDGQPVVITGVVVTTVRPDGTVLEHSGSSLTATPLGPRVDLVLDQAGTWRVLVECTGPRAASIERQIAVAGSDVRSPAQPGAVWVTKDLWALLTQQGLPITAERVPALPAAGQLTGAERLPVVRGDVTLRSTVADIAEIAATAGAADAGAAAGATAGATAGAEAGANAGSVTGSAAGADAGAAAASPIAAQAEAARDVALTAAANINASLDGGPVFSAEAELLAYAPADGKPAILITDSGSRKRGVYRRTAGAWPATPESDTLPAVEGRVGTIEGMVRPSSVATLLRATGDEDGSVVEELRSDGSFRVAGLTIGRDAEKRPRLTGDDGAAIDLGGNLVTADHGMVGVGLAMYDADYNVVPITDDRGRPYDQTVTNSLAASVEAVVLGIRLQQAVAPADIAVFNRVVDAASGDLPAADALLARMDVLPPARVRAIVRATIGMLQDAGIWGKLDALYVPAMHTAQAAKLNWISRSYNLVTSETFVPYAGFAGSGSSSTGFNPSTAVGAHFSQNSASLGLWVLSDTNLNYDAIGNANALIRPYINSGQIATRLNSAATAESAYGPRIKSGFGLTWASRRDASGYRHGRNDAALAAVAAVSVAPANGAIELGGGAVTTDSADLVAFAFIGGGLADEEVAALYRIIGPMLVELLAPDIYVLDTATEHQTLMGIGFELQSDSIEGDAGGIQEANTSSLPLGLTTAERTRFAQEIGAGFSDFRLAMGLYYRGVSADGRNFVERLAGQNAAIADFIAASGVPGICYTHWSPAPYWKRKIIDGVTYRGSEAVIPTKGTAEWNEYLRFWLQGGTLDHPDKATNPSGYGAWMNAFANAVLADMEYVHTNVGRIVKFSPQNEPNTGTVAGAGYPACIWDHTQMYDFMKVMVPKIRASAVLGTYGGVANHIDIFLDGEHGQTGVGGALVRADADLLAEIYGWSWHVITVTGSNASWPRHNAATLNADTAGKPVYTDENEYFDTFLDPASASYLSRDYRFVNTFLMPMYWFVFVNSPTWYWIHIGKPSDGPQLETEGRALTIWRPVGAPVRADYPALAEGHFEPVPVNWNAIRPWIRHMPRGSVRVEMATPHLRNGVLAMAWKTPAGKLVIAIGNREASAYSLALDTATDVVCAGWLYDQHAADMPLGTKRMRAGSVITVPPYSAAIWTEV